MRRVRECVTWVFLRKSSARTRQQMRSRASSGRRWFRACPEALEERWLLSTTPVLTLPVKGGPANAAQPASALVVGQQVFYNNSSFDGHLSSATAEDDAAIATDKTALRPGETATFANYTSYSRGINGVMVDLAGLLAEEVSAGDFQFRVSSPSAPSGWISAPAPSSITVRAGAGDGGTDRVTVTWPDNVIQKQWLHVTVLATTATGLLEPYAFYYGNAVADSGDSPSSAAVNAGDELAARNHPQTFLDPAAIDNVYDFDRDGFVNATDQILARNNSTSLLTALQLISVPSGELDPSLPPGQNFDLNQWNISLPINESGGTTGIGVTIWYPELETYSDSYFHTGEDGAMVFYSPVIGAKTSLNTAYTRSELRELNADGTRAFWDVAHGGTMTATVAVDEMPVATNDNLARVVVGQIHGPNDELCRLYYDENGKMYYVNDKSGPSNVLRTFELKNTAGEVTQIPLGGKFEYRIDIAEGVQTVSVVYQGETYSASEVISSFWTGLGVYFKAGLYLGVGEPGSGGGTIGYGAGQASFYALEVAH